MNAKAEKVSMVFALASLVKPNWFCQLMIGLNQLIVAYELIWPFSISARHLIQYLINAF